MELQRVRKDRCGWQNLRFRKQEGPNRIALRIEASRERAHLQVSQ